MKPYRPDLLQRPARADVEPRSLSLQPAARPDIDEPANLKEQLRLLWRHRWLIAAITLSTAVLTTTVAFLQRSQYQATVLMAPVTQRADSSRSFGALGALATEMGGLAALAGFGGPGEMAKNEAVAVLQSEALTEQYISSNHLLPVLYEDKWDPSRRAWKVSDPKKVPTLWKANRFFDKTVRKVTSSGKTGLVTLTITWTDPTLASKWANDMVHLTNDYLRNKAIEETQRNISYLNAEAAKTNVIEVRQAIFSVLRNEIDRAMLARGSEEYAFKVLDPAVKPELASSPVKKIWALGGFAGGLFLSVLFVYLRNAWRASP
jgi:capsular polysaccharide biosynthesis protein